MAALFDAPLPSGIDQKRALLLQNRVALWDVIHSCVRPGSLDADIREARPNDFAAFFRDWPGIEAVFFNGSAAQALFRRLCPGAEGGRPTALLPSTSPARTMPFDQKLAIWRSAMQEFGGRP
jgi:hypoxanthine-DNA glycosylase